MANTPYDDVFRTMLNDCASLVIPLLNEAFGERYTGEEEIRFFPNEHYLNREGGREAKRITDTCFTVHGADTGKYHLECQSTESSTMPVRIFEYDAQIALDGGKITGNVLLVEFPRSAVLYLRSGRNTPEQMKIRLRVPGDEITYAVPTVKIRDYTLEKLFEKNLLFLLPFYSKCIF